MNIIVVLVVTLFTYNGDGGVEGKVRHEFIKDSMAECEVALQATMDDYYDHTSRATSGIMAMCRRKYAEVSSDGQSTESSEFTF